MDSSKEASSQPQKRKPNFVAFDNSNVKPTVESFAAITLWLGWLLILPSSLVVMPYLYYHHKLTFAAIAGPIVLSALYPVAPEYQPKWGLSIGAWIMRQACIYFSAKIEFEDYDEVKKSELCIFALEPHDVLPVSIFFGSGFLGVLPQALCRGCLSSACFRVPLMRHIYTWASAVAADKADLKRLLGTGYSIVICPGGVQEVAYLGNDSECVLYLQKRVGLTKLALEYGASMVPVMTFGQRKTYDFWISTNSFIVGLGRKIGFLPMLFFGVGGIPLAPPKPTPLTIVVGSPIPIPKISNPSQEEVMKYHKLYLEATEKLYEDNKVSNGHSSIQLRIV